MILGAIIALTFLGGLFGIGLAIASEKLAVKVDPKVEKVLDALPGANCGACGFPGCSGFAVAVVEGQAEAHGCIPGGAETAERVAAILGVEVTEREPEKAILLCGGANVADKYEYDGLRECRAAALLHGGPKACEFGCMGFGTCADVCPFEAIRMGEDGLPEIIEERCTGCRKCEKTCPKGVIRVYPISKHVHVRCQSIAKGGVVRKLCEVGCIGCKKCEKACEKFEAIKVENNLAVIDYEKCVSCGKCVKECPQNTIINLRPLRKKKKEKTEDRSQKPEASKTNG